jgi:predicted ferric reductase
MALGRGGVSVVVAATAPKALWYLTRGTGVVTLLLLTTSVVLGIVTSMRWSSERWPRFVIEWLHRNVSLVVLVFLGVHIGSAVIDGFVPLRWLDAVVPFSSAYKPLWVGLGAVAFDLLIAVVVTSLVRLRIGYSAWRIVHWTAYACWPLAVVHSIGTGSDTAHGWILVVDGVVVVSALAAGWWRLAAREPAPTIRMESGRS